jgi:hypothetical protein
VHPLHHVRKPPALRSHPPTPMKKMNDGQIQNPSAQS